MMVRGADHRGRDHLCNRSRSRGPQEGPTDGKPLPHLSIVTGQAMILAESH
jgi:hypothetical protein